jgi:hypothetical protein
MNRDIIHGAMKRLHPHQSENTPNLVPAGSVDRVFLIGGKNLTMFQSIVLVVTGTCLAGGFGGWLFTEFDSPLEFKDHLGNFYILILAGAMAIWGLIMIFNGIRGIVRRLRRGR